MSHDHENNQGDVQQLAESLFRNDVLACQSCLVDELLKENREGFQPEDIENIFADPEEWTLDKCRDWLDDHGIEHPDPEGSPKVEDWRDTIRDNDYGQEVLEWWLVTSYLMERLREIGEPLIDNDYGEWWGRTCSGQSVIDDGTLKEVATSMLERRPTLDDSPTAKS